MTSAIALSEKFLEFNHNSPTTFHVCKSCAEELEKHGFVLIAEDKAWEQTLELGGKYYFTRNGSALCAFVVGNQYAPGNAFKLIGAHTDSPVLKIKPVSKREGSGIEQIGVETYGNGLWHTWFDRDLGIAGRVIVKSGEGEFWQQLVHIDRPILRIATLAVHLRTSTEKTDFAPNPEDHLAPLLSSIDTDLNSDVNVNSLDKRHCPKLLVLLADELGVKPEDIVDFELNLCPVQKPVFGGANKEFIFAPRLGGQLHSFLAHEALIAVANENNTNEDGVLLSFLFDHDEVGARSNEGAASPLVVDTMQRISEIFFKKARALDKSFANGVSHQELYQISIKKSILVASDGAHAVHPNYPSRHESKHKIEMGKGPSISTSSNQDYATNAITGFFMRELARQTKIGFYNHKTSTGFGPIPIQDFIVKNDQNGTTSMGPHIAARVGIRTVDIGVPQLSMHSIREQCAMQDIWSCYFLFRAFYKEVSKLDERLSDLNN